MSYVRGVVNMSEPTRGQLQKVMLAGIDKVLDQAIANQKEINKQYEQLLMMTQAQAVVIKDIIDTVDIIDQKIDNIDKGLEDANLY